jgi:hypothetical protein
MPDKKRKASPQGIRISPEVHDLMTTVAAITGMQVGEAYTEAAAEWLRKQSSLSPIVRSLVELKSSGNPELRVLIGKKPSLLANRA